MSIILKANADGVVTLPVELCQAAGIEPKAEWVAEIQTGRIILEPVRPSLAERIVALANNLPQELLVTLPTDGAARHDHYLYGASARPV